jgi:hypothetical protein
MPTPMIRLAFCGAALLLGVGCADATEPQFPPLRGGLWELQSVRGLPSGKSQKWTQQSRACPDANLLFQGYWGLGILEKAGCRFESTQLPDNRYRIASECMVRGVGRATSEGTVTLSGDEAFDLDIHVQEGKRRYHATQHGRRMGDCAP